MSDKKQVQSLSSTAQVSEKMDVVLAELEDMKMLLAKRCSNTVKPIIVFYIDVTRLSADDVPAYIDKIKDGTKKEDVISYYIPIKDYSNRGSTKTRVEVFMPNACQCSNNNTTQPVLDYNKLEQEERKSLKRCSETMSAAFRECCETCDEKAKAGLEKRRAAELAYLRELTENY